MRLMIWFLVLFSVAVATALFMSTNESSVTLFWEPYRVDLSLNLIIIALLISFFSIYSILIFVTKLLAISARARAWRVQSIEKSVSQAFTETIFCWLVGRFARSKKLSNFVLAKESDLLNAGESLPYATKIRALSHYYAAESAHALLDFDSRNLHLEQGKLEAMKGGELELQDGFLLQESRWRLEENDPLGALKCLKELSQAVSRRTLTLRIQLKALRLSGQLRKALEIGQLLVKHRAFSQEAGEVLMRNLTLDFISEAQDLEQLRHTLKIINLDKMDILEIHLYAAEKMLNLKGNTQEISNLLKNTWFKVMELDPTDQISFQIPLVLLIGRMLSVSEQNIKNDWIPIIEAAQQKNLADPVLQYLMGLACIYMELWGKAQIFFSRLEDRIEDKRLQRLIFIAQGELADQRSDVTQAAFAWRKAAQIT